jgi:hypothetical protein
VQVGFDMAALARGEGKAVEVGAAGRVKAIIDLGLLDPVVVGIEPGAVLTARGVARPVDDIASAGLGAAEAAAGAGGVGGSEDQGDSLGFALGPRISRNPSAGLRRESTELVQAA